VAKHNLSIQINQTISNKSKKQIQLSKSIGLKYKDILEFVIIYKVETDKQ